MSWLWIWVSYVSTRMNIGVCVLWTLYLPQQHSFHGVEDLSIWQHSIDTIPALYRGRRYTVVVIYTWFYVGKQSNRGCLFSPADLVVKARSAPPDVEGVANSINKEEKGVQNQMRRDLYPHAHTLCHITGQSLSHVFGTLGVARTIITLSYNTPSDLSPFPPILFLVRELLQFDI